MQQKQRMTKASKCVAMISVRTALLILLLLDSVLALNAQRVYWLGTLYSPDRAGGERPSEAYDVSEDGRVVVGRSEYEAVQGWWYDVVWHPYEGTIQRVLDLNHPTILQSSAIRVSRDGSVILGNIVRVVCDPACRQIDTGFVWDAVSGARFFLPNIPYFATAVDMNRSATHAVGRATPAGGSRWDLPDPAVWELGNNPITVVAYPGLPFLHYGQATAISEDAKTIAIYAAFSNGSRRGSGIWILHPNGEISQIYLGDNTYVGDLSEDGMVAVGYIDTDIDYPVMWRAANNWIAEPLARLNASSPAYAVAIRGNIIVGYDAGGAGKALRWRLETATTQVEDLNAIYAGVSGGMLKRAYSLSADGRYIVGRGRWYSRPPWEAQDEAFMLDTWREGDTNGDSCIDDNDLLAVLFAFGTPGTGYTRHEDINKDGIVDDADLLIVLFNFGQGC